MNTALDLGVTVFIRLPIQMFIVYTILSAIHVDRLVWFLFWVYFPLGFIFGLIDAFHANKKMSALIDKAVKKEMETWLAKKM